MPKRRLATIAVLALCASAALTGIFLMPISAGSGEIHAHPDALGWVFLAVVFVAVFVGLAGAFFMIEESFRREEGNTDA